MIACYYHVTYVFESESTLYTCLNVKEVLAWNRRNIWSLSDKNGIRTHNHLVRIRTLNHLASLGKWLSVHLRTTRLWVRIPLLSHKYWWPNLTHDWTYTTSVPNNANYVKKHKTTGAVKKRKYYYTYQNSIYHFLSVVPLSFLGMFC